jgi:carboxypeptidase C (cathepsin A)
MSLDRPAFRLLIAAAIVFGGSYAALAQTVDKPASSSDEKDDKADKDADKKKDEPPKPVVTHHTATIDGKEIKYTATAGKMLMTTDEGDPKAHVFFVAYTLDTGDDDERSHVSRDAAAERDDDKDDEESKDDEPADDKSAKSDDEAKTPAKPNRRPITFCFNGGPGSSSVWLHLGMLGPVRVKLDSDAGTLPPPHELIANPYSLLDVTDLVFIDPVSTGFSRPAKGQDKDQFHGYSEDIASVGQFIHDYTTKYARWGSPKFLIGESYGGLRAAGLAGELQNRYRLYVNGIVLVSAVVDFQTLSTWGNNDVAYAMFLPSFAATAWYHKQLDEELQDQSVEDVVAAAEEFAAGPYLHALTAGDSLDDDEREEVVERMAELTGLSEDFVDDANLRVGQAHFSKQLFRDEKLVVGRFDSRYKGPTLEPLRDTTEYDPSASAVFGTFGSALNDYVRGTLKVKEDRVYEILTDRVHPWNFDDFTNSYVDASETLRFAMTLNPHLKVLATCGYYDLATPSFAMEHTRDHLHLTPEIRRNFTIEYYEGGHMMYAHEPSLKKLRADLLEFYEESLPPVEKETN